MTNVITIGDRVRSFDFPDRVRDLEGDRACYAVGRVEDIVRWRDCNRYKIRVEYLVWCGKKEAAAEEFIYPPLNGTPISMGGMTSGVEKVSAER